jgi:hypothetical protein
LEEIARTLEEQALKGLSFSCAVKYSQFKDGALSPEVI